MNYLAKIIAALFICLSTAGATHAALIQGTAKGFIAEHAETRGDGVNVFGLGGNSLLNQSFAINFYYRTDIAPVTGGGVGASDARTIYQSSDAGLDWLGLSLTVNNITYDVIGNNRYADVLDIYANPILSNTDHLQLAVEGNSGPFNGSSFRRQFLDFSVFFKNDVLNEAVLPNSLKTTEIQRVFNSAVFQINNFDINPATGDVLSEKYISFNMDIRSIEAAVIPVPAPIWLLGLGFAGLIIRRRKHQH